MNFKLFAVTMTSARQHTNATGPLSTLGPVFLCAQECC